MPSRVLITRAASQAPEFVTALGSLAVEPILFPTIEIQPTADGARLDIALLHLADYDWLLFTSVNAVKMVLTRLMALGLNPYHLTQVKVGAVGPATAVALTSHDVPITFMPATHTAEELLMALAAQYPLTNRRMLLPQADIARSVLAEGLTAQGAQVEVITAYQTCPLSTGPQPPVVDIITFTSSSTVQGYINCLAGQPFVGGQKVICIGPSTAQTATDAGLPVTAIARPHTIGGIVNIIQKLINRSVPSMI